MKIIYKNKKAYFDYEILHEFKAGLMLLGSEIKSIRKGNVNLKGSYISMKDEKPILKGANVSRYAYDTNDDYEPFRDRPLLLKQPEIDRLINHLNTQGVTIIPLFIGLDGKYAKLQIAVARGKKKHDKRQTLKERDSKRQVEQAIKRYG